MTIVDPLTELERPPEPRRFTVEEYLSMAEAGIFKADERVQLINGEIVRMSPMGFEHGKAIALINALLTLGLHPFGLVVTPQLPVDLRPNSMPEPDLAVYPRDLLDRDHYPEGRELLLAVEVADSSLKFDQGVKLQLYAKAAIREYWLVNVQARTVVVHRRPDSVKETYGEVFARKVGERVSVESRPDVEFAVGDFFGVQKRS
jgi:Uma2 family endonuclease